MKKIKILQTPARFYPDIGGVNKYVLDLSRELVKKGYSVTVICANEPPSSLSNIDGIQVNRLSYSFKITNTNITFSLPWKIVTSDYDIMHTHMPTPWSADWSIIISKLMHKKSVITIHNDMDKSTFLSRLVTKIYLYTFFKITLALADKIIIVNPTWEDSFIATRHILQAYKHKIASLPNGIDLATFNNNLKVNKKNRHTLLFVSILDIYHKYKGLEYLLHAVKMIKRQIPHVELRIVGEGQLKRHYQHLAKSLGIADSISFVGEITHEELARYYQKASVFILPSTEIEGFGIVLLEAMACQTPVVTTTIAGTSKDIAKNNAGFVVQSKNADALADAILRLLQNPQLAKQMGINGRKLVEKNYDWHTIATKVANIYTSI